MNIREMTIEDYDQVFDLWRRADGVGLHEHDQDSRAGIEKFLMYNPGLSLIAEIDGQIVGAVLVGHDGRAASFHHLAVDTHYRRQGIGRQLVYKAIEKLRNTGITKCFLLVYDNNDKAVNFWRNIGFAPRTNLMLMARPIEMTIDQLLHITT